MNRRTSLTDSGLTAVRTIGAAMPPDVLARVVDPKGGLPGLSAEDFGLELGITPTEAANRAWSVLTGAWAGYQAALDRLPEGDRATSLTRDKWLLVLLRELGFGRVPTTPTGGILVGERSFPVSHESGPVPIHLLGRDVPLDTKTPGLAGAADRAPHAMAQELLNRSDERLWAIVANGTSLRLLRDSSTLVGQSYVEFDLAAIFDGDLFADFTVLYLICHHTRFQPDADTGLAGCWLERWRTDGAETGARALGALRDGVKEAIEALGTGFLRHPANSDLRERLDAGTLDLADIHRSLLRLVYRLLFLFVAEDRQLLLDPYAPETAKTRYRDWFSTARLRHVARRRRGSRHDDLWQALRLVLDGLGHEAGRPELGLPALGGIFENGPIDVTAPFSLGNEHLLAAIRHLSVIQPSEGGPRRVVDYRNLGAEELGGIYESLLEYVPQHDPQGRTLTLEVLSGNDRKTSGAYYTPTSLIDALLDSTLDPILDRAEADSDPEEALLALTVCDPACGSGHFLVAAAKRIAHRVARVRAEGAEPTIAQSQAAMHDVVARCIYGVDLNPMAAELAKVSLWLESLAAGRPLSFLDPRLRVGDSLLGATPDLLAQGIPDEAFTPLEDDDKAAATELRQRNARERSGQDSLFGSATIDLEALGSATQHLLRGSAELSLSELHVLARRLREHDQAPDVRRAHSMADTWCAAFLVPKTDQQVPTTGALSGARSAATDELLIVMAGRHQFFHWPIEFPEVFASGGFDAVIGNPPFISPLAASGSRVTRKRHLCKYVRGSLGGPKADDSSYFLLLARDITKATGRFAQVLPDSFLSASDAADIRQELADKQDLAMIWRGDGTEFEASVTTIIVSMAPAGSVSRVQRLRGPRFIELSGAEPPWRNGSWATLLAEDSDSFGIMASSSSGVLGDFCSITADYRDQYYGLRGAVREAPEDWASESAPPLITTGLIDPLVCYWGTRTTKFDKVTYERPVVEISALSPDLQRWARTRLVPKLVVATQGKMVEAALDREGAWLPCVPVISISPAAGADLSLAEIAAILLSPAAFDYFKATKLGSGLGGSAIKVSAADLRGMPAPPDLAAVADAAERLPRLSDPEQRLAFRIAMNRAFGVPDEVGRDWDVVFADYLKRPRVPTLLGAA